jgi:hypothetical protein
MFPLLILLHFLLVLSVVRMTLSAVHTRSDFLLSRVLMLRRKASPTETELRIDYSHMVNEALEMIPVECQPGNISKGLTPSVSTDIQAQP